MRPALLYSAMLDGSLRCDLCAHRCVIHEGREGICKVRVNRAGTLHTQVYGRLIANNLDPIEKKPLFHFYPATLAYSVATPGCNFHCQFCQNWEISQMLREEERGHRGPRPVEVDEAPYPGIEASPERVVEDARRTGARSVAFTYTEPTIYFEYAYDTACLAHNAGLANVFVTNGYMTPEALELLAGRLDAANVDVKAFRDATYRRLLGARLEPVLDSLRRLKRMGVWLETTTLIVPGVNDSEAELRDLARFLAREVGPETPWHVSRFIPAYHFLHCPPTPVASVQRAREIGFEEGLRYVYGGNVGGEGSDTACYRCQRVLVRRRGYIVSENRVLQGCCPDCGAAVDGIGMSGGGVGHAVQQHLEGPSWA